MCMVSMIVISREHIYWLDVVIHSLDLVLIWSATEELRNTVIGMLDHEILGVLVGIWWSAQEHEVSFFFVSFLMLVLIELFIFIAKLEI